MAYVKRSQRSSSPARGRAAVPRRRHPGRDPETGGPAGGLDIPGSGVGLGAVYVAEGGGRPRCPVCSACAPDQRKGNQFHCSVCGHWSAVSLWGPCEQVVQVVDPYPTYPVFVGRGGGRRGGGGGHHGHHGFGDDVVTTMTATPAALPPMPVPGASDEQTALLRRVAVAQENFNKQDLKLRYIQIAAVAAIPIATSAWNLIKKLWSRSRT